MCGIAGLLKIRGPVTPEYSAVVERMTCAQSHRGPDGSGMYLDTRVVLGHQRLSIIDLPDAGKQPMANADGTIWGPYNIELYHTAGKKSQEQHGGKRHFGRR